MPSSAERPPPARPKIVVLCGRTIHREAFRATNARETLAGHIVLSCGVFKGDAEWGEDAKCNLDGLHRRKIELADEVVLIEPDDIGDSTRRELAYAQELGRPIRPYCQPRTLVRVWYEGEHDGAKSHQDVELAGIPGTPAFEAACRYEAQEFRDEHVVYGYDVLSTEDV